jgi:uncharacterized protein YndB with AHSA1/START domain
MSATDELGTIDGEGRTRTARFERVLAHPPERVWEALTSSGALERWFMVASIEPRAGGAARFDTGDGVATGTVTLWDPPRALGYLWPFPADGEAHVAWSLEPVDDGARTRLVLEHTKLPADWAAGYGSGWHAYLDRLAASLEGQQPPDWSERAAELRAAYDAAA